jgi:predicted Zn-dependent peptidase
MLTDAIMFSSFLAHPYRNNTIGWESDIENLKHDDVVHFYEQHYHPANGVLAVVGDLDPDKTLARISDLFGGFRQADPTPLPVTVEPLQEGERRIDLRGNSLIRQFMIGYRAPSANHPDFAAFLVLQELLGGGSGVSFLQNDWGTMVREGSLLSGAADNLTTWYPPSAQDYIFVIGGSADAQFSELVIEDEIENRIATARLRPVHQATLATAISRTLDELVFDVETTEDAAHQLAFFDGLHALDKLLALPRQISSVTADEVLRVAQSWLKPERRTIAWHRPMEKEAESESPEQTKTLPADQFVSTPLPIDNLALPVPMMRNLSGGIPVVIQESDFSAAAQVQIIFQGNVVGTDTTLANSPVVAHSSITYRRSADLIADGIVAARAAVHNLKIDMAGKSNTSLDPETRLEQAFDQFITLDPATENEAPVPKLIVVSGNMDPDAAFAELEKAFGSLQFQATTMPQIPPVAGGGMRVELGIPVAQSQIGYITSAPGPEAPNYDAVRILQYVLSHGYEGRLGTEAISKRGLAYYIDSRYRSDGTNGWVTLGIGVDPQKMDALQSLLQAELQHLRDEPPTVAEIEEAKTYYLGRARSAAQSNDELSVALARQWLWHHDTAVVDSLQRRLEKVTHRDVLEQIPGFTGGLTIVVAE